MHCREFDENLLRKVFELMYENELLDLPYAPDVGDYLVCEDTNFAPNNKDVAPIPEGMSGAEVGKRLNGLVSADLRFCFALIFRDLIFFFT
jgi:RNA polymerase II C-terminal domain phosphatase-like 1/2